MPENLTTADWVQQLTLFADDYASATGLLWNCIQNGRDTTEAKRIRDLYRDKMVTFAATAPQHTVLLEQAINTITELLRFADTEGTEVTPREVINQGRRTIADIRAHWS